MRLLSSRPNQRPQLLAHGVSLQHSLSSTVELRWSAAQLQAGHSFSVLCTSMMYEMYVHHPLPICNVGLFIFEHVKCA